MVNTRHINLQSLIVLIIITYYEAISIVKAASERHADGDVRQSIRVNRDRFVLSDQLAAIFENTVREMGW